jgi:hypothetical protein
MANGDGLARKFAYQVYPLLREYYKDGILIMHDEEVSLAKEHGLSIDIHYQMPSSEVFEIISEWAK